MKREKLIEKLKEGVVKVVFTKADGTTRTMNASLHPKYITEELKPKGNDTRKPNPDLIHVIDTDLNQWRSFKMSSLMEAIWKIQ